MATSTTRVQAPATRLYETGGPTVITLGAIPDNSIGIRSGLGFIGKTPSANVGNALASDGSAWNDTVRAWGIGATSTPGLRLGNTTPATSGVPVQYSPALQFDSRVWDTDGSSETVAWRIEGRPTSGTAAFGALCFLYSVSGGAWASGMEVTTSGLTSAQNYARASAALIAGGALANGSTHVYPATQSSTGLGTAGWIGTGQSSPLLMVHRARPDETNNIVFAAVYDHNSAAITNAATMRLLSLGTTNNADVYTERAAVYCDGRIWSGKSFEASAAFDYQATSTAGLTLSNTTAATAIVPIQYSPAIIQKGTCWNTTALASQEAAWMSDCRPVDGATISSKLTWATSLNGGAYSDVMALSSDGTLEFLLTGTAEIYGTEIDGAGAVGAEIGSYESYTTAGAKLLSVMNSTTERAAIDYQGDLTINELDNGQMLEIKTLSELLTILAAADTDSAIEIPAGSLVIAVSAYTETTIPSDASDYDVGVAGATTRYAEGIGASAGTSHEGTDAGIMYYAAATKIKITPDATPLAATGKVRLTIHYIAITAATS